MKEIIYSGQKAGFIPGLRYANPRLFNRPRDGVTSVIVIGNWPLVAEAYRHANVHVVTVANDDELKEFLIKRAHMQPEASRTPSAPAARAATTNPDDKRPDLVELPPEGANLMEMEWSLLRNIANAVSKEPCRSRPDCIAAINAERARRAAQATGQDEGGEPDAEQGE